MRKFPLLAFFSLLAFDAISKMAALACIPYLGFGPYPFGGIGIFTLGQISCSFNLVVNTGAAWGVFAGYPGALFLVRALIICALFLFGPKKFPIWLILAGAVGNAIDYCLYGHVIDFIHFSFWGYSFPIFNIADSCITMGILSLLLFPMKTKPVQPA